MESRAQNRGLLKLSRAAMVRLSHSLSDVGCKELFSCSVGKKLILLIKDFVFDVILHCMASVSNLIKDTGLLAPFAVLQIILTLNPLHFLVCRLNR